MQDIKAAEIIYIRLLISSATHEQERVFNTNQWTKNIKQTPTQASSRGKRVYTEQAFTVHVIVRVRGCLFKTTAQGELTGPQKPTWQLSSGYLVWGLLSTWPQREAGCSGWGHSSLHCQAQMEDTVSSSPHHFFHCQLAAGFCRLHGDIEPVQDGTAGQALSFLCSSAYCRCGVRCHGAVGTRVMIMLEVPARAWVWPHPCSNAIKYKLQCASQHLPKTMHD